MSFQDGSAIAGVTPPPMSPDPQYHPDFLKFDIGPDISVTLVSRDRNTLFRVSANTLRSASPVFATMLSLPQPEGSDPSTPVIDNLDEDATTIEGLLRMITGRELPSLDTVDAIEPLLLAAVKWEMPGPISILKMVLFKESKFAENHPIRLYALGCRLKWDTLVDLGARFSCTRDIVYRPRLDSLFETMEPGDLLLLVRFHRRRRDKMKQCFDGPVLAGSWCIHNSQYQDLRARVLEYMDRHPPGKALLESELRHLASLTSQDIVKCGQWDCRTLSGHLSTSSVDTFVEKMMVQWGELPQHISTP